MGLRRTIRSAGIVVSLSLLVTCQVTATSGAALPATVGARAAVPTCNSRDLTIRTRYIEPAGGSYGVRLIFINHGTVRCSTYGYPGVDVLRSNGTVRYHARRSTAGPIGGSYAARPPHITLRPGAAASTILEGSDRKKGPSGLGCPASRHKLVITPPNTYRAVRRFARMSACQRPDVHSMVRGRTGSGQ